MCVLQVQWERTAVLDKFRKGGLSLIVATDVAARGLDIDGITHGKGQEEGEID